MKLSFPNFLAAFYFFLDMLDCSMLIFDNFLTCTTIMIFIELNASHRNVIWWFYLCLQLRWLRSTFCFLNRAFFASSHSKLTSFWPYDPHDLTFTSSPLINFSWHVRLIYVGYCLVNKSGVLSISFSLWKQSQICFQSVMEKENQENCRRKRGRRRRESVLKRKK